MNGHLNWINWFHSHHYSSRRPTCYSDRSQDFSVPIPKCYKDFYVNSFFPRTTRLWNSVPIECFPWAYDFLFPVTLCLVVAVQPCMEWIPIKKNISPFLSAWFLVRSLFLLQKFTFLFFLFKVSNLFKLIGFLLKYWCWFVSFETDILIVVDESFIK